MLLFNLISESLILPALGKLKQTTSNVILSNLKIYSEIQQIDMYVINLFISY